jgi:hypothetical protein
MVDLCGAIVHQHQIVPMTEGVEIFRDMARHGMAPFRSQNRFGWIQFGVDAQAVIDLHIPFGWFLPKITSLGQA